MFKYACKIRVSLSEGVIDIGLLCGISLLFLSSGGTHGARVTPFPLKTLPRPASLSVEWRQRSTNISHLKAERGDFTMNAGSNLTRILAAITAAAFACATLPVSQATEVRPAEFIIPVEDYIPSDVPTSGDHELDLLITRTGRNLGVDPRLIHAVIWQDSKYKPSAESHAGAQGLIQLMPAAAKRFGCEDRNDAAQNVMAGTKYLRFLLKRFDGNVTLALAAYNAGEGNVDKYEGVPPFGETEAYVRITTGRYGKTYHPVLTPEDASSHFNLLPENTLSKSITIHGESGRGTWHISRLPDGSSKLTVTESIAYDTPRESEGAGRVEVLTVSRVDGQVVFDKRIYYAPALNPGRVRKYRQPSSAAAEMLPVGAEFTFWAGEGDDSTPISDKVTITVQPRNNTSVVLQLKESVASAK
jgi:hypothetical protein